MIVSGVWSLISFLVRGYGYGYGYGGMMGGFGGFWFLGLVCGIAVIIGALLLNARPLENATWGALIIVFSVISFIGMGGFFIGALLGIAGGALALSWRPSTRA